MLQFWSTLLSLLPLDTDWTMLEINLCRFWPKNRIWNVSVTSLTGSSYWNSSSGSSRWTDKVKQQLISRRKEMIRLITIWCVRISAVESVFYFKITGRFFSFSRSCLRLFWVLSVAAADKSCRSGAAGCFLSAAFAADPTTFGAVESECLIKMVLILTRSLRSTLTGLMRLNRVQPAHVKSRQRLQDVNI